MTATRPSRDQALPWATWRDAVRQQAVDGAIRALYDDLAHAIAQRSPTCWLSGKCCNFEAYGHRLYVTGLEVAWLIDQLDLREHRPMRDALTGARDIPKQPGCPFQIDRLCGVHALRPLGCRIYFCQQGTQEWQQDVYEAFLARLRQLHEAQNLPYAYLEWRVALAEASAALGLHAEHH